MGANARIPAEDATGRILNILLIGGGGLLGTPTARALLAAGHRVSVLARGGRARPTGVDAIDADRSDPVALALALEGRRFDFTVDFLVYDAPDIEQLLLLPYAALGRYVMISSGQVYLVARDAKPPFREEDSEGALMAEPPPDTADHREWRYGMGKRRAEAALRKLRRSHGVRGLALRLPVVQGANDGSRRLWAYLQRMRDGGPLLVPGGGASLVRFVWAEDVARALVALAAGAEARAPAYNLAQPEALPLREFLQQVAVSADTRVTIVAVDEDALASGGLTRAVSPYSGPWCSNPVPARAETDWGFRGTPVGEWLPTVVRAHLEDPSPAPHPGYTQRSAELALASRLVATGSARGGAPTA